MKNTEKTMDQIVALCKGRGFVYPGSEIYGGLANSWDYGPLGVELKNNVKRAWWKKFVQENPYNVGLDAAILMNPEVWVASGHVSTFNDPLIDCKACKMRHRADKLIELVRREWPRRRECGGHDQRGAGAFIRDNGVTCPGCGKADFTDIRKFNLMFKTHQASPRTAAPRSTCAPRPPRASSSTSPPSSAPPARSCLSECARWASPSATRSPPATSSSASGSLSRWSWSSSASRAPIWSGSSTGGSSAASGWWIWA